MNTNYIPLYRKYRPQELEQIVGQEHIKRALINAIKTDRISHAYLFTGPRGTGKTSTARIFAKSLNCVNGPTITPCNKCVNCTNITNSIPIDVIEIDAASNRSVNDADEIIQKVALAPVQSKYKIYIIDEVHMLTTQAFNALLKTLEEPPQNVIFILATTEVHKVLDTIKSRCQRFDFKRITTDDITRHLRYISDSEKINITDEALHYIAQNSAGGMRDSIALLDQLSILNSQDTAISVLDINNLLGRLSFDSLTSLFLAISESDQNTALEIMNKIYNEGNEPVQILSNFLDYLRNALIIKSANCEDTSVLSLNSEQISELSSKLVDIEVHQLVALIDKCANYIKELKLAQNPKLWLDVATLDMSNLTENTKLADLQRRISGLENEEGQKSIKSSPYNTPPQPVTKVASKALESKPQPKIENELQSVAQEIPEKKIHSEDEVLHDSVPMSKAPSKSSLNTLWIDFVKNVQSPSSAILQQLAKPVKITSDEIIISINSPVWIERFAKGGEKYSSLEKASAALFGSPAKKIIIRAPQSGDDAIRKEQDGIEEMQTSAPKPVPSPKEEVIEPEEINEAISVNAEFKSEKSSQSKTLDMLNHSDEVNMVMQLFDGKLIE